MSHAYKLLTIACLLGVCTPRAQAQATFPFIPGYVVTTAGDTLQGEVQRQLDLDLARGAAFRAENQDVIRKMVPADIQAFGFHDGAHFILKHLSPGADHPEVQPLFLQLLVEGQVSLYSFSYEQARLVGGHIDVDLDMTEDRYAVERDGAVTALYRSRRAITDAETGARAVRVDHQYRRALASSFHGCPAEQQRTTRLRYTRQDLIRAVQRYHACVDAEAIVVGREAQSRRSAQRIEFAVRVLAGTRTLTQHRDSYEGFPAPAIDDPGAGGSIGLEAIANIRMHAVSSGLSLPIAVKFSRSFVSRNWTFPEPPPPLTPHSVTTQYFEPTDFERFALGVGLGVRYQLPRIGWAPYAEGGLHTSYLLGDKPVARSLWRHDRRFAEAEAGWNVEAGLVNASSGPLSGLSLGLRYDSIGMGLVNPLYATTRGAWRHKSVMLSVGMGF